MTAADRTPREVAEAHLEAVRDGDPAAMASDYDVEARLVRGDDVLEGRAAIEAYFRTVPERLGSARVVFDSLELRGDVATFRWHLDGAATPVSGTDTCTIRHGLIRTQHVRLDGPDF